MHILLSGNYYEWHIAHIHVSNTRIIYIYIIVVEPIHPKNKARIISHFRLNEVIINYWRLDV